MLEEETVFHVEGHYSPQQAHSEYLTPVFKYPGKMTAIAKMVAGEILMTMQGLFETIVVRGVSGMTIGAIVAAIMNKRLVVVRKPITDSHAEVRVEGAVGERYVIVDDLICSGDTITSILDEVSRAAEKRGHRLPRCEGIYLYTQCRWVGDRWPILGPQGIKVWPMGNETHKIVDGKDVGEPGYRVVPDKERLLRAQIKVEL
jgi:hypothetical protein